MKKWQKISAGFLGAISVTLGALGMVACGGKNENSKTEEKAVKISTLEGLKGISNGSYALENDIDLQGEEWTPIANFTGKLDGQGYKIYNFQLKQSQDNLGFIAENNGTIKNVTFDNVTLSERSDKSGAGIVAGKNTGTIESCTVSGEIDAPYCQRVGGIVGINETEGKILYCINNATVKGRDYVGGVAGRNCGVLENCQNKAVITGNKMIGGIAGSIAQGTCKEIVNTADVTASDTYCGGVFGGVGSSVSGMRSLKNSGNITSESTVVGGIVGGMQSGNPIEDVENTGNVQGTEGVGGIFGKCEVALNIVGFENEVSVTGTYSVGGIVGWAKQGCVLTSCRNLGTIEGKYAQGGLVGGGMAKIVDCENTGLLIHSDGKFIDNVRYSYLGGIAGSCSSLQNCKNVASISGVGEYVGGLAGWVETVTKCTNTVYVKGTNNVGGIAGHGEKANDVANSGKIVGENNVGGIFGGFWADDSNYKIETSKNEGEINGKENVGGVVGYVTNEQYGQITFINSENTGIITGTVNVGGIVGWMPAWGSDDWVISLTGCKNSGVITAKCYQGGIVGAGSARIVDSENRGLLVHSEGKIIDNVLCSYFGGIAGQCLSMENCTNVANVKGVGEYVGGLAGTTESAIKCTNIASVKGTNNVGGIAGRNVSFISDAGDEADELVNRGKVEGINNVGGVFGSIYYYASNGVGGAGYTIKASHNEGEIKGVQNVGGIVGYALGSRASNKNAECIGNTNKGTIIGKNNVGGCLGYMDTGIMNNNVNEGNISGMDSVGGIVGYAYYATINYCENTANVEGITSVGGVVGFGEGKILRSGTNLTYNYYARAVEVKECKNGGVIKGENYVGGISGKIGIIEGTGYPTANFFVEKCINIANVESNGYAVGGICGGVYGWGYYSDRGVFYCLKTCTNSGTITGAQKVGGIVGEQGSYVTIEDTCTDSGTVVN